MTDWVDKIREPLDLKRAGSLKVQVNNSKYICLYIEVLLNNVCYFVYCQTYSKF